MRKAPSPSVLLIALVVPFTAGCSGPGPARLAVEIAEPARAVPLVFHGSCQAGWQVSVDLRVRETGDATVWLDGLDFTIVDVGQPRTLAFDSLDAVSFASRYGDTRILPGLALVITVGGRSDDRPAGPVTVDGGVRGRDENGNRVTSAFHLTAAALDVRDPGPDAGGACGPPPDGSLGS